MEMLNYFDAVEAVLIEAKQYNPERHAYEVPRIVLEYLLEQHNRMLGEGIKIGGENNVRGS